MRQKATFKPKIAETRWNIEEEEKLLELWEKEKLYEFNPNTDKPIFSIDTPQPYASGAWHVGAAAHYAQIDMVARYFRMLGYEVLFPFGIDRNGLPVEVQVEKKYGIRAYEVPREKFIKMCKSFLDEVEKEILHIAWRLGLSANLKGYYQTDSPEYRALTQATFIELWRRGLIYEAEQVVIWCPGCRTTIAESEVEYAEKYTDLVYIKFKVKETGEDVVIATTRPELLCTCALVIFNPADKRYKHLEGKHVIVPIFNHVVPIRAHPAAKIEFGTGLVMVCSFGDLTDVRIFRELGLKHKIAINPDGTMNEVAGPYKGLKVDEARRRIIEDLERQGLIVKKERIKHKVPICWRSKDPLEFITMKEFFLKQMEFKDEMLKLIEKLSFHPPRYKKLLEDWIKSISMDWPISRRRYYGTEIPIWYCKKCGHPNLPPPGKYYRPWCESPPFKKCEKCGASEFIGETRVFDTWMDSSISPLFIAGYLKDKRLFRKIFPVSLRPQGYDIIRTWLYYTLLRVYQLTGKAAFKHIRISGMGLDEKGEAMHKSKGNIVPPIPVIKKYGADALRFWAASESKLGDNYRYSETKIRAAALFITKLWNIARFISAFPYIKEKVKLTPTDYAILGVLNDVIREYHESFKQMDTFIPANKLRYFTWNIFASHYIELVKERAYNRSGIFTEEEQKAAWYTLHTALRCILKMLAPIIPFVTDALWRRLYGGSVHKEKLPEPVSEWDTKYKEDMSEIMKFNAAIWGYKKKMNIPLRETLKATVYAPERLKPYAKDLRAMHKIEKLVFSKPPEKACRISDEIGVYVA